MFLIALFGRFHSNANSIGKASITSLVHLHDLAAKFESPSFNSFKKDFAFLPDLGIVLESIMKAKYAKLEVKATHFSFRVSLRLL